MCKQDNAPLCSDDLESAYFSFEAAGRSLFGSAPQSDPLRAFIAAAANFRKSALSAIERVLVECRRRESEMRDMHERGVNSVIAVMTALGADRVTVHDFDIEKLRKPVLRVERSGKKTVFTVSESP